MELPEAIHEEIWQSAENDFIADFFTKKVEEYFAAIPPCAPVLATRALVVKKELAVCCIYFRLADGHAPFPSEGEPSEVREREEVVVEFVMNRITIPPNELYIHLFVRNCVVAMQLTYLSCSEKNRQSKQARDYFGASWKIALKQAGKCGLDEQTFLHILPHHIHIFPELSNYI